MINEHMVAQGAILTNQVLAKLLQQFAPLFKQAEQVIQAKTPQPPMPPEIQASLQIAKAETDRKTELDKATFGLRQQEMNIKTSAEKAQTAFEQALEKFRVESAASADHMAEQVKMAMNEADNRQHQVTEILKNQDDNRTNMNLELARIQAENQRALDDTFDRWKAELDASVKVLTALISAKAQTGSAQLEAETVAAKTVSKDLSGG